MKYVNGKLVRYASGSNSDLRVKLDRNYIDRNLLSLCPILKGIIINRCWCMCQTVEDKGRLYILTSDDDVLQQYAEKCLRGDYDYE